MENFYTNFAYVLEIKLKINTVFYRQIYKTDENFW